MLENPTPLDVFLWSAFRLIGTPYIYGGDDPSGVDCNGIVNESLQAAGLTPDKSDYSAAGLYELYQNALRPQDHGDLPGCLVFRPNDVGAVKHVGICIGNGFVIHAGGGDADIDTADEAWKANAFVKIRPIGVFGPNRRIRDPFAWMR